MGLLAQFFYLQVLDALTTLAFLAKGVEEANPFVGFLMELGPSPVGGLVLAKLAAVALGVYCWRQGRWKVLGCANWFYALLVAWNLLAMIAGLSRPA